MEDVLKSVLRIAARVLVKNAQIRVNAFLIFEHAKVKANAGLVKNVWQENVWIVAKMLNVKKDKLALKDNVNLDNVGIQYAHQIHTVKMESVSLVSMYALRILITKLNCAQSLDQPGKIAHSHHLHLQDLHPHIVV